MDRPQLTTGKADRATVRWVWGSVWMGGGLEGVGEWRRVLKKKEEEEEMTAAFEWTQDWRAALQVDGQ